MIKIGDFSKLAHVTVKTLHHYGELGLLRPAHIDRYTGYRYYTLEQLPRLNQILALKDLGFSLDQVAQLTKEDLSTAEIRGMLRMKQMELAEQIESEQATLARVETRLRQLERGGLLDQEVAVKAVRSQVVLSARGVAASEGLILPARESLQILLNRSLAQARLKPVGPWFAIKDDLTYAESDLEVEMAIPVRPRSNQRAGDWNGTPVSLRELPEVPEMASLIHDGDYDAIQGAYTGLYTWTQANAYVITGPCREVYLPETGFIPTGTPDTGSGFIEVQCPVERALVPISISTTPTDRKENKMTPKYENKPAMTVVGLPYLGKNENNEIHAMWGDFNTRSAEIQNFTGKCAYGACFAEPEGAAEGEFEYVACFEVSESGEVPEGMVVRHIPAYRYAVFTHKGKLDTLGDTYQYIFQTWLPQSGVTLHPDKFDMELYDDRWISDSDESEFDILVAIQE